MFHDRPAQRPFNRSPLPSLEQLRARILLERESAGLQPSASTSAASQAARAYALEKLLGNSGTDVFYDHTPDGTLIGRAAATPSPTAMARRDADYADMASDDESAHESGLRRQSIRQSIKNRPMLRRSRTINGLTAMAEAQNKAEFVQGVFLAVPGPASNRISRIHQRRVERQSMLQRASTSTGPSEPAIPEHSSDANQDATTQPTAAPTLERQPSQRQIARTEMMRKLSTRGRGTATPTSEPSAAAAPPAPTVQHPRLPQLITDSPAVDETISPVGVVIRPPSSPVPPHMSHLDLLGAASSPVVFRQNLSPASAAHADIHTGAVSSLAADLDLSASPSLKPSSSAASLASNYAHSTATNATAHHNYERNRESAMALLENEDNFGFEASPSFPSIGTDLARAQTPIDHSTAAEHTSNRDRNGVHRIPDANASDNEGLSLDFGDARTKRRAGLVGLGLDSVAHASASPQVQQPGQSSTAQDQSADLPSRSHPGAIASDRNTKARQSLAKLSVKPSPQDLLSSPASYTDDEPLEDEAFYKLYSPAAGLYDDDDDEDEDRHHPPATQATQATSDHQPSQSDRTSQTSAPAPVQGLGLIASGAAAPADAELPNTPPQRLFYRGNAAVPCDPSPGTETDFGDVRRTPWMGSSPGGFNLPLRLSKSLISTAQSDSPAPDPSPVMRGPFRRARGDWPMSVASSGTHPASRESLESRSEPESRFRSSEEGGIVGGAPAIGSPLIELPEDEAMGKEGGVDEQPPQPAAPEFELLSPSSSSKPSERVQAMLGSSFVAEYGAELESESRSRSSIGADEDNQLQVPGRHRAGSTNTHSNVSINDMSDVDGEVDEAYLQRVDRMADKLGKIARAKHLHSKDSVSRAVVANITNAERGRPMGGSRFTEQLPSTALGSQRTSADLSALAGNEKLHPFPGLTQASPLLSQEGFSPKNGSPPSASRANSQSKGTRPAAGDSPTLATGQKEDAEGSGRQIGLFSSLRRKASSLRRTPSSAKGAGGFLARRGKKDESPKMPSEASFISAPILTTATPGPPPMATQPVAVADKDVEPSAGQADAGRDVTFEHRLFGPDQSGDSAGAELQRNASISSVVSARIRGDLQDGTADADALVVPAAHGGGGSLAPNTAAVIHRYSRMLSGAAPPQTIPGASQQDLQDPPRKLLATDAVFQVISATTIKDRYLFLFSDLLVIAKPVAAPGAEAGQTLGKMKEAAVLPSLSWRFAVKNILELHRLRVSVTTNTRTASAKTRAQNPVLWGFVSHFSREPDSAVRALVAKTGLEPTPASIAQLLYQTPELDRQDLTAYLGHAARREILKAYVSQHRPVGVSIESALRSLLLDLRFPHELDAFEALLVHFAQSWTQANAAMIKPNFTAQLASDLVFAIMALNDALHTGTQAGAASVTSPNFPRPVTVVTPGLFSAPCPELSKADFVSVFRQHDPEHVLSDRTLSRIYLSIKSEPLVQALDRYEPRFTIRVKGGKLPTRLTYAQPAEPVTLVIPAPDPDLAIRLYAPDTTFEPPVLTFGASREASFTMWTKSLGAKQVVFVRAGRNARFYGGTEVDVTHAGAGGADAGVREDSPLPRSFNVAVERAFMKHSFTLTSVGEAGGTKRFMLSFEDGERVARWTHVIREQVAAAEAARTRSGAVATARAMQVASLEVLRETLIGVEPRAGLSRAATVTGVAKAGMGDLGRLAPVAGLDRTTSTSRHYYASSGVGRHERELLLPAPQKHTKGSASLSLTPMAVGVGMTRSNSARSASANSPAGATQPLPPAIQVAEPETRAPQLHGTAIVRIARLNSLLPSVVQHHLNGPSQ